MPFPLAHPAAVLPLRRLCPRYFDYFALVIGSLLPDFAYALDDLNKFSRTVTRIFGPAAADFTAVRNAWDWDEFSHSFVGSIIFCVPIGISLLKICSALRSAFVRTLPNPHRTALLSLCTAKQTSFFKSACSLLVGIWTHVGWDLLTNPDRWAGGHRFLQSQLQVGPAKMEVCRIIWFLSSLGGMAALVFVYCMFLRSRRSQDWLYQPGEHGYYLLWFAVFFTSALVAIPLTLQFVNSMGTTGEKLDFLHRFSGYCLAISGIGVGMVTVVSKLQEFWSDRDPRESDNGLL